MKKHTSDFELKVSKYTAESRKVIAFNQSKIAQFDSEVRDYASKINKINIDYQWMMGRYVALKQEYNEAFGLLAPKQEKQRG